MLTKLLCKLGLHAVVQINQSIDEYGWTSWTAFGCIRYGCRWQGQYDNVR